MEILEIHAEPIARDILGKTSGLTGKARVKTQRGIEIEIPLSRSTLQTMMECVDRDFDLELKEMSR